MLKFYPIRLVALLLGLWGMGALNASPAQAQQFIRDEAGFFSNQAVSDADARIGTIKEKTGKSLAIETVAALPEGKSIDEEAHQRFQSEHINGLLVLISKNPKGIATRVGAATGQLFGEQQQAALRESFTSSFKQKDFDGGLRSGVAYTEGVFRGALAAQRPARRAPQSGAFPVGSNGTIQDGSSGSVPQGVPYNKSDPPQSFPSSQLPAGYQPSGYQQPGRGFGLGSFLPLIFFAVIAIIVIRALSGLFGGRNRGGGYWGNSGNTGFNQGGFNTGGGGGFLSGLLGGAAGSVVGNALYDRFSNSHNNQNMPSNDANVGAPFGQDDSAQSAGWMQDDNNSPGSDFGASSSWGNDDNSSSSSDIGGSSSFGDSGGGDAGGGGGDSGSSSSW